jgi:phytanoyl-CoA hydroxylase
MVSPQQIQQFQTSGYTIVADLFSPGEVEFLIQHYMALREQGEHPGDYSGVDLGSADPLKRYPRMIHMHRWDQPSLDWMIDPRIAETLSALMGREPYAVQTTRHLYRGLDGPGCL